MFSLSTKVLAWFLFASVLSSQVTLNGSLVGSVVDPSAQAVATAKVVVTRPATNFRQSLETDSNGRFQLSGLQPGVYDLSVEKAGFQRLLRQGVTVEVNQTVPVTLGLTLGEVTATVTVRADAPALQSQSSDISLLVDESRIRDLPLNGKDFQKLVYLAPGMGNFRSNNSNSNVSTSGARESANNYVIDGITANDERETAGLALGASFRQQPNVISTEAISEFRVITSNADATFGRGSGAQINVVTKSGTNQLHGSAYEYFRNSALDARDFFNRGPFFTADGKAKTPPFRQNLFGATAGGPIVRDKHFFFGSYEGFRQRLEQTSAPILPSASLVNLMPGQLGRLARAYYFDQGIIPTQGFVPGTVRAFAATDRSAAIAAGFPTALFDGNLDNGEAATIVTSRSSTRDFDQNAFLVRTDHQLRSNLKLGIRYAQAQSTSITNSSGLPGTGVLIPSRFYSPTAQAVWTLSPSQLFEFRTGVMRRSQPYRIAGGLPPSITQAGVNPDVGVGMSLTGTTTFQLPAIAPFLLLDNQTVPQIAATHTWIRRNWTLRTGGDVRWIQSNFINRGFARPAYSFVGLTGANGLLGASPTSSDAVAQVATQTIFGANGGTATPLRGWRSTQQEYFAQADWRLRRDFTLNLGLRYSYFGVYHEVNNSLSNLYAVNSGSAVEDDKQTFLYGRASNRVEPIGPDRPFYQPDRNNFQPRAGFAWNLGGRERSVLRGASGLYNDRLYQLLISEAARNVPFAVSGSANNVPFSVERPVPINPNTPVLFGIDPTLRSPLMKRWNLSYERLFGTNTTITAAYVGSYATGLYMRDDNNFTGAYPQASRPDPRFTDQRFLRNLGFSRYSALQLFARRRFADGFTFSAAYTFSRYMEITSNDTEGQTPTVINTGASPATGFQIGPTIPRPIDSEYGRAENDAPHALAVSYVWSLPYGRGHRLGANLARPLDLVLGGWSFSGIVNARSGNTFDVQLGQDVNDDGAFNDRPALASGASLNSLRPSNGVDKTQWLLPQTDARNLLIVSPNVTDPFASIRRNSFRAPALIVYDMSLTKKFSLGERIGLNIDANFFNLFNRANFRAPVNTLTSPFFGQIQATAVTSTPRQIQLGMKFTF
ncbi:MAG TPA: TonB-dependent receptor [Bryobacteraceae bacterium]|nr:TonB-dependent receptor [Bryobacteraceae bacterium]